ncbi:MAG: hypothetical protein NTZ67_05740 [Gammaproteobacteria bacterium]|nr:hypothetical protein [Gammaproteobacteria bacterium]
MTKPKKQYIVADPLNSGCVVDSKERPSITAAKKQNDTWESDYARVTGISVTAPSNQKLSRNHRISDNDIKRNIILDMNTHFRNNYITALFNVFPWAADNVDKNEAIALLGKLKSGLDIINTANNLYVLMASHVENISYGNANQNSAIQEHLDLNAPRNSTGQHSLTPRSRHILNEINSNPVPELLSMPIKNGDLISSSQYALGGAAHKDDSNIDLRNVTPRTENLFHLFFNPAVARAKPHDPLSDFFQWIEGMSKPSFFKGVSPNKASQHDVLDGYFS